MTARGRAARPATAPTTRVWIGTSPLDATKALLTMTTWLLQRGTEEPPASWRRRDPSCRQA